ncbi:hypothetical protein DB30_00263 [Enhygromyxa salina]|uniref:Uncharacterized protein n=1 Tax=Enhygromyxa salina TaxID=215803 RepID=A0A0C2A577_9BACT|nr:hypothetical protein [Enhygromyxa salina]KIG18578.1 hypothetical protein DB30_00263 [Enhygromyxa salina]
MDDHRQAAPEGDTLSEETSTEATLEQLLETPVARREPPLGPRSTCLVGECLDDRHPTLQGRVRVRLSDPDSGDLRERWVPRLQGLSVRAGDRVLMIRPDNSATWGEEAGDDWIVTGVIDGFAKRPRVDKQEAARLELQPDEAVRVVSRAGQALLELSHDQDGPIVRLLEPDVRVELAGKLAIKAEQIELEAEQGEVSIKASADVVLRGEVVRLN